MKTAALKHSIKTNVIFSAIYQLFKFVVPFITAPYISRVLGVELVGFYSYTTSITFYFAALASLGFDTYGNWQVSKVRDDPKRVSDVFWEVELAQVIVSFASISIYLPLVLTNTLGSGTYRNLCLIMGITIIAEMLDTSFLMAGEEEYVSLAIRGMLVKITSTVLIFALIKSRDINALLLYAGILAGSQLLSSILVLMPSTKYIKKINSKNLKMSHSLRGSGVSLFIFWFPLLTYS